MKKIVLFGDSITFGYGVYEKDSIAALLRATLPYEVINSGVNGDTTREALARLKRDVLDCSPDILTVLFGSNDSAMSDYYYRTSYEFEKNITAIINKVGEVFPQCRIILITPPPVDDAVFMPSTLNKRLIPYIEALKNIAEVSGCELCDLNTYFILKSNGSLESFLQEDGCHLTEKGYKLFFDCLSEFLEK